MKPKPESVVINKMEYNDINHEQRSVYKTTTGFHIYLSHTLAKWRLMYPRDELHQASQRIIMDP